MFDAGRTISSFGGSMVAQQPEAGGMQQRPGGVDIRRDRRKKGQISHQAC